MGPGVALIYRYNKLRELLICIYVLRKACSPDKVALALVPLALLIGDLV
jgi:hypothetical protein